MIKIIAMDVDGTLTDGKIYIGDNGEIMKAFSVKDGLGLTNLKKYNIIPILITGRNSKIVTNRALELGITEVYQNITNKGELINNIILKYKIESNEIAYIGDDINDYEAMMKCEFKACPLNATEEIKEISNYVSKYNSGDGAVRDIIDYILKMQK